MRTLPAAAMAAFFLAPPAVAQGEISHSARVGYADSLFDHLDNEDWALHDAARWPNGAIVLLYCHDETGLGSMIVILPIEVDGRRVAAMYSPGAGLCQPEGDPS